MMEKRNKEAFLESICEVLQRTEKCADLKSLNLKQKIENDEITDEFVIARFNDGGYLTINIMGEDGYDILTSIVSFIDNERHYETYSLDEEIEHIDKLANTPEPFIICLRHDELSQIHQWLIELRGLRKNMAPQKVLPQFYQVGQHVVQWHECPNCRYRIDIEDSCHNMPYCPSCGAALDWDT